MKHYLVLAMRKPNFDAAVVAPHLAFLDELRERGLLAMTGGFSDKSGGAYVLKNVDNLEQARVIVAADPLAIQDASELIVHEWNVH
jgi:uncharacterized protein YciI